MVSSLEGVVVSYKVLSMGQIEICIKFIGIQNDHLISARRSDQVLINKNKKENLLSNRFIVPEDHRVKIKENKKRDKYLDLDWELEKLRSMRVTVIPIVIGALGTVSSGLEKKLE